MRINGGKKLRRTTHSSARIQTTFGVLCEFFPGQFVESPTLRCGLLGHEEEAPALEVPRFDLLVVRGHDAVEDEQRWGEQRQLQEQFDQRQSRGYGRQSGVV